jgi:hypothetical protein
MSDPSAGASQKTKQTCPNGGRKALKAKDPVLAVAPDKLIEPCTYEDPMRRF